MTLHYSDSHAHLTYPDLYNDIDAVLARAWNAGVKTIVNICTNEETLQRGLSLREKYPWIYHTAATTPHDVENDTFFPIVAKHAHELIAIGETGLDYYYEHSPRDLQKEYLIKYLHLAKEHQLPIIIHCREAFADLFQILDTEYKNLPLIMHCFTGTIDEAKQSIDRGHYISISGIVTFKKSESLREVAKWIPLDRLLIETDSPYLAPQTQRGKKNEPAFIVETAALIASLKNISIEELSQKTTTNLKNVIKIDS